MKRIEKGFGIVEMLISMVIGLVLLLGVGTILMSMTRTSDLRQKMAETQGSQRMAMTFMSNGVRYAGAFPFSGTDSAESVFPAAAPFAAGQSVIGTGNNTGTDTLSVRFVGSSSINASQGCAPDRAAGHIYTDRFWVSNGFLMCTETDVTAGTDDVPVRLIKGVTRMDLLYGVQLNGGGFVSQYLTGAEIAAAPALWDNVKTVKVKLTFTNPLAGEAGQADKPTVDITQTIPHAIGL
jgi:type IV pilus assembly protein PilW